MAFTLDTVGIGIDSLALMISVDNFNADLNELANDIRSTCELKISRSLVPAAIYVVEAIPKNERGKPLRKKGVEIVSELSPI